MKGERHRRVLVLALAPFRDAALLVGPLAVRRHARPGERITVAAPAGVCELLTSLRLADDVWEVGTKRASAPAVVGLYQAGALLARARRSRFDDVVDLFPTARSVLSSWLAAGANASPSTSRYVDGLLRRRQPAHVRVDERMRIAGLLGVDADEVALELGSEPEADAWIERALGVIGYRGGGPVVVVNPAGTWPDDRYAEVANRLRSAFSAWLVVLDTPRESGPARGLAGALGGSVLALGAPSGQRFVAALERASVVLTDDPAVTALAALGHVPALDVTGLDAGEAFDRACPLLSKQRTGSLFNR